MIMGKSKACKSKESNVFKVVKRCKNTPKIGKDQNLKKVKYQYCEDVKKLNSKYSKVQSKIIKKNSKPKVPENKPVTKPKMGLAAADLQKTLKLMENL